MRFRFSLLLPALGCLFAASVQGGGLFESLGTTPQELCRSGVYYEIEPLTYFPMTPEEEKKLLEEWLSPENPDKVHLASLWFEFKGRPDEALKLFDERPDCPPPPLQFIRLLYRNKRFEAASAAFAKFQEERANEIHGDRTVDQLASLLRPMVAKEAWVEVALFLAWLQPRCTLSDWRTCVLTSRMNLALQQGLAAELLARLAVESPVTGVIANHLFDVGAYGYLPPPPPGTSVADLAWCIEVDDCTMNIAPAAEAVIRSGEGSANERRELFRRLSRSNESSPERERLLKLWRERKEEFLGLEKAVRPISGQRTDREATAYQGAKTHPELSARVSALDWFVGPEISGFPMGYAQGDNGHFDATETGVGWITRYPFRGSRIPWLGRPYPGLRLAFDLRAHGGGKEFRDVSQRLRDLLPADSPHAVAFDIAHAFPVVYAPPEARELAAERCKGVLATRNEPEFVLFRASAGASLIHCQPAENPEALFELRALVNAPVPIRRAAGDVLGMGGHGVPESRREEYKALLEQLFAGIPRRLPTTRWPSR
jgi:hypothetical protein